MARLGCYGKDHDEEIQNWPAKAKGTLRFHKAREMGLSDRVAEVIHESLDTIEPENLQVVSVQCLSMFPWTANFVFQRWLTTNEFITFSRLGLNYSKSNWDTRITPGRNKVWPGLYDLSRIRQKMFEERACLKKERFRNRWRSSGRNDLQRIDVSSFGSISSSPRYPSISVVFE